VRLRSLIVAGSLLLTAAAPEEPAPETRVLAAVTRLREALRSGDRKALDTMIAPGFVMVHATGAVEQRDAFLAALARGATVTRDAMTVEATQVRVHDGRTAVVVQTSRRGAGTDGTELRVRHTSTWIERGGAWVVVAAQSTRLPVLPQGMTVTAAELQPLVGTYVEPDATRFTVEREGERLVWRGTRAGGVPWRLELVPIAPGKFRLFDLENDGTLNASDAQLTFLPEGEVVRTEKGKETRRAYRLR
jgi:ketosteroid isomerase-like protein